MNYEFETRYRAQSSYWCSALLPQHALIGTAPDPDPIDAREVLNAARDRSAATSYHATFRTSTHPSDVRGETKWEAYLQPPDRFRFLLFTTDGESDEICQGNTCYSVLVSVEREEVFETVGIEGEGYGRSCGESTAGCTPWQGPFPVTIPSAGPSPSYMPGWPIIAAEMAQYVEVTNPQDLAQDQLIHVRGRINHIRAILENQRRVMDEAGVTSFGEVCENGQACRDITFEEYLNQQSHLEFYDRNTTAMDVWIGENGMIKEMRFRIPPHEAGGTETVITVEYSGFGEVAIERPA